MNRPPTDTDEVINQLWQPGWWIGFLWGFAEGTLFFIIPDILLSWASLTGAKRGMKIAGAIVAGALVGGLCMYVWAESKPASARSVVASVPFVRTVMFEKVREDYSVHGVAGMLRGPSSGIPYKIYAVLAPPFCGLLQFLLTSIPARLERLALSWFIFTIFGWLFGSWMRIHRRLTITLFAIVWIGIYAFYWTRS
jgi:hypothetical protein